MSLSDRTRAFLQAESRGDMFSLVLSACDLHSLKWGRRKWARRFHYATIETTAGVRIKFTYPRTFNRPVKK